MFGAKIVTILSLLASGAVADDIYTTFYNSKGAIKPDLDTSNNSCFSVSRATAITFDNPNGSGEAEQYCLHAWTSSGCPGQPKHQQSFEEIDSGSKYPLNAGLKNAASYKWLVGGCTLP